MGKAIGFIKSVVRELKLVTWPSKTEVWSSTKVVVALSLILVLIIFLSDQFLSWLIKYLIN